MPRAACRARDRGLLGVTGGKTRSEYIFSALPQIADITRSADHAFWARAIPCAGVAQQRHKIIRNRVALAGDDFGDSYADIVLTGSGKISVAAGFVGS